jgi:hypothetical protein
MATDSGYPNQKKTISERAQHVTIAPIREQQWGYDVNAHQYVQEIATDAAEANSTASVINATAHAAIPGDVIYFTSGALDKSEYGVLSVTDDTITVVEQMRAAPSTGDVFQVMRFKHPVVNSSGSPQVTASPGPTQYLLNGSAQEVTEDTGTPANNRFFPVKIGDDTDYLGVNADGSINAVVTGTVAVGNFPTTVATDAGNADASTIRTVIATDQAKLTVDVDNFPATQTVDGTVDVGNFPATQTVDGTVDVGNFPTSFEVSNFPASQTVDGTVSVDAVPAAPGRTSVFTHRHDYSAANVTTAAYTEIVTSTAAAINRLRIFDSSGEGILLAFGASTSEADQLIIPPGGHSGEVELHVPSGTRLSVKALTANATDGDLLITALS